MSIESETYRFEIKEEHKGGRSDKVLADLSDDLSRARIQDLIAQEQVNLNGEVLKTSSRKVEVGDVLEVIVPPPEDAEPEPQDIPLDIIFEDDHLLVINKPVGMVVHPGAGNYFGTLVNAILFHCKDNLSGIGGVLRPGIVHRLDKNTSGLMIVAKNDKAHRNLSDQLAAREVRRLYKALVLGVPMPIKGKVDQPIGRHPGNRLKMTIKGQNGRDAVTHYKVIENYRDQFSLLECRLETGRTHQIRVHMAYAGYPLIGDQLYGPQNTAVTAALKRAEYEAHIIAAVQNFNRQALHAYHLTFTHPITKEPQILEVDPPADLSNLLKLL